MSSFECFVFAFFFFVFFFLKDPAMAFKAACRLVDPVERLRLSFLDAAGTSFSPDPTSSKLEKRFFCLGCI